MACPPRCTIGKRPDQAACEYQGQLAIHGEVSWNAAAKAIGVYPQTLKTHMMKHLVLPSLKEADEEKNTHLRALIEVAKGELEAQFYVSPSDVKPLILAAIHNLDGLLTTKPSQEVLLRALKTAQEMTGMKTEQRLMLDFADAMFGQKPVPRAVPSTTEKVLEIEAAEEA